jgi:hypothetical protein
MTGSEAMGFQRSEPGEVPGTSPEVISRFLEGRSVALEAFTIEELALAILAAELIPGRASRHAFIKDLAAGQGVSVLRSEGSREPSGEDQQRPNQPGHLLAH